MFEVNEAVNGECVETADAIFPRDDTYIWLANQTALIDVDSVGAAERRL